MESKKTDNVTKLINVRFTNAELTTILACLCGTKTRALKIHHEKLTRLIEKIMAAIEK